MPTVHIPFRKSLSGRLLVALALVALISVVGLGLAAYFNERTALEMQVKAQLTAIADLKKAQIVTWLDERQADIRLLAVNKLNQEHFTEIFAPQIPTARKIEFAVFVTDNIISMQQSRTGYSEVSFVDTGGTVVLSTDSNLISQPTQHKIAFEETLASADGSFVQDIHFDPNTGHITMAFGHIIHAVDLNTGEELPDIIGVALLIVDMDKTIYPLLQVWPEMIETGETLLVRVDKDSTLFLNNLRFDNNAALNLRLPVDSSNAESSHLSARGHEGIMQTSDYRGVPVLAAYRHIPNIDWGFVAKEDLSEAFAPVNVLATRIGLLAVVVLLVAGLISIALSRTLTRPLTKLVSGTKAVAAGDLSTEIDVTREDEIGTLAGSFNTMTTKLRETLEGLKQNVAELERTEAALRESEERFRSLLESASEGIVVVDERGQIELVNAQIEQMFGYNRDEVLGQNVEILLVLTDSVARMDSLS